MNKGRFHNEYGLLKGWVVAAIAIPISVALLVGLVALIVAYERHGCHREAALLNAPYRFGVFEGCYVRIDGKWLPLEGYRGTEEVNR